MSPLRTHGQPLRRVATIARRMPAVMLTACAVFSTGPVVAAPWQVGTPRVPVLHPYRPAGYDGPIEQAIEISAARREAEPFMLYIIAREKSAKGVSVEVSALTQEKGGVELGPEFIEVAPLAYVKVAAAGSADPSLAGESAALRRAPREHEPRILRRDVSTFDVPAGCQQAVWVNVEVPVDAEPGPYAGRVTVRAADRTVDVPLRLLVRRFCLPQQACLAGWSKWSPMVYDRERQKVYDFTDDEIDRVVRFLLRYRWRATRIYQKVNDSVPLPDVDLVRRWAAYGATDITLLRVDVSGACTTSDPQTGRIVYKEEYFSNWWNVLDARIARLRDAGLLDRCMIYGFDERPRRDVTAIDDTFARIKKRYGDIPTMTVSYIWTALEYPELEHVDMMGYVTRLLTPELRDLHHERGQRIFWYNISRVALVPARVQFWATFKDGLDGLLFYNMAADMGCQFPADEPFPLIDKVDRAPLHYLPDGPTSTTILEMWREGFDDVDYLHLLKAQAERVRALVAEEAMTPEVRKLLAQADYYGGVPDSVTAGKLAEAEVSRRYNRPMWKILGERETYALQAELLARLETDSMAHVIYVRSRIAELIEKLMVVEKSPGGDPQP